MTEVLFQGCSQVNEVAIFQHGKILRGIFFLKGKVGWDSKTCLALLWEQD